MPLSIIRYPGSKAKLYKTLAAAFPIEAQAELWASGLQCYCEPFFGSGAICFRWLKGFRNGKASIIINDIDPWICSLWKSIRDAVDELCHMVEGFKPSAEAFYQFKEEDGRADIDPVIQGFRKLALHRVSFSGLGAMSGGPLGGKDGRSEYQPGCRWNRHSIIRDIRKAHKLMKKFRQFQIHNEDFAATLARVPPNNGSFVYLDPPYYVQGANLYKYAMVDEDHVRLAKVLSAAAFRWVLSYDDHPAIRELYTFANIRGFSMTPTMQTSKTTRRKNEEIIISNF